MVMVGSDHIQASSELLGLLSVTCSHIEHLCRRSSGCGLPTVHARSRFWVKMFQVWVFGGLGPRHIGCLIQKLQEVYKF